MDKNNIKKEYSNGEITVVWQSGKCKHSANSVSNLPQVFNTKESLWIKLENTTTKDIITTVEKCPSGALTFFYNK
ncbi:MAG: (4Fe-4S)-binding protein [Bacteroidota bacterium]|nr:(4Fe-4S)-binding protein [Bacteroidota bacterium]